jgi:hypothetical protein
VSAAPVTRRTSGVDPACGYSTPVPSFAPFPSPLKQTPRNTRPQRPVLAPSRPVRVVTPGYVPPAVNGGVRWR